MTKKNSVPARFRFSVPTADISVLEWIECQDNLSFSLRQLIHESIQRKGMQDVTCEDNLKKINRGRPSKTAEEDSYDYTASSDEKEIEKPSQVASVINEIVTPAEPEAPVVQNITVPTPQVSVQPQVSNSQANTLLSSI